MDYIVGGILEQRAEPSPLSGITSPVFRCIVVDQFRRWKRGDRFFFDLAAPSSALTEGIKPMVELFGPVPAMLDVAHKFGVGSLSSME